MLLLLDYTEEGIFFNSNAHSHLFAEDVSSVVVFQRRRNRSDSRNNFKVLGLPNDYLKQVLTCFMTVMKQVRVKWPNAQYHILSQANATTVSCRSFSECTNAENVVQGFDDFRGISANDVLLDLDIPEAFHAMVSADVLIDSPSSFCFAAALNV